MDSEKSESFAPYLIGVDPGDEHNGFVVMDTMGTITAFGTESPDKLEDGVPELCAGYPRILVVEEFRLYAGRAQFKNHSTLRTVEVIGALKYAVRQKRMLGVEIDIVTIPPSTAVPFFKNRQLPEMVWGSRHELSAWKVAEWFRLFKLRQHPLAKRGQAVR